MKTVIVLGTARSGTSMISGLVHHLGIDMNPHNNPSSQNPKGSYEDRTLIHLTTQIMIGGNEIDRHIANMNLYFKHRMSLGIDWGFKSALTHEIWQHIDLSIFKDLYIICNSRSVLTNTKSWLHHLRENYGVNKDLVDGLLHIQESNNRLFNLVSKLDCKKMYTCYEEVKENPERVVGDIVNFLDIKLNDSINNFILPKYSSITN